MSAAAIIPCDEPGLSHRTLRQKTSSKTEESNEARETTNVANALLEAFVVSLDSLDSFCIEGCGSSYATQASRELRTLHSATCPIDYAPFSSRIATERLQGIV